MRFSINTRQEKKDDETEIRKNIKIASQILLVVFSMCLVTFLMFFATYHSEKLEKTEKTEENVQTFEESDFYKLITYEISKNAGECVSFDTF